MLTVVRDLGVAKLRTPLICIIKSSFLPLLRLIEEHFIILMCTNYIAPLIFLATLVVVLRRRAGDRKRGVDLLVPFTITLFRLRSLLIDSLQIGRAHV